MNQSVFFHWWSLASLGEKIARKRKSGCGNSRLVTRTDSDVFAKSRSVWQLAPKPKPRAKIFFWNLPWRDFDSPGSILSPELFPHESRLVVSPRWLEKAPTCVPVRKLVFAETIAESKLDPSRVVFSAFPKHRASFLRTRTDRARAVASPDRASVPRRPRPHTSSCRALEGPERWSPRPPPRLSRDASRTKLPPADRRNPRSPGSRSRRRARRPAARDARA